MLPGPLLTQMNKKLTNEQIAALLPQDHWPHLDRGQSWKKAADSFKHVCRAVKKLNELGMPSEEAAELIRQLYWCAYGDIQDMPKPAPRDDGRERPSRYFDEHGIMFSMKASNLTPEELKRDYKFYCNAYAKGNKVWWSGLGGGASGGPIHDFLNVVRGDNNYAFGPTKTQQGWSAENLAKVNAVGVYKRKEPPVKMSQTNKAKVRG